MTGGPGRPAMTAGPGTPDGLRLVTLAERPDLADPLGDHNGAAWPEFMLQDAVADRLWHHLDEEFAAWQFLLLDADDRIAAGGNTAPCSWDGTDGGLPTGWDDQFERSVAGLHAGEVPNTLGAPPGGAGRGLPGA
jgi:hypothetical protein